MELVLPSEIYKESFLEGVQEFKTAEPFSSRYTHYKNMSLEKARSDFPAYLAHERDKALGKNLPEGFVPQTNYWLIDNDTFLGGVSIRHFLTEKLLQTGGHVGYDIRPSMRGHGYGTKILALALPKAREFGIERALITCDTTNVASRKIIERNGGVFENQIPNPEGGPDKLRFWITL